MNVTLKEVQMNRIKLLAGVMLLSMLAFVFTACAPQPEPAPPSPAPAPVPSPSPAPAPSPAPQPASGTIDVYVTDAPPEKNVTAVLLTISSLEVHLATAEMEQEQEQSESGNQTQEQEQEQEEENGGVWVSINISDNMSTFDLLKVKGIEEFFGSSEVAAGKYTQVRLIVDKAEVAVDNGEPQEATVPSNEVKIVRPFTVEDGETTTLLIDFDAEHSVVFAGSGKIQVKPVVKLSIEQGEKSGKPQNEEDKDKDEDEDEEEDEDEDEEELEEEIEASVEVSCDEFASANHTSRELEVEAGDLLMVILCSNPTTGFEWSETANISDTSILEQVSHEFIPPQSGQSSQTGTPGQEVWVFRALEEGTSTIYMEYSRPWQGGEEAIWTFELTVTIE
jgi:predicted secreted protein